MAHIFDVGTRAWQPDAAEGWVASEVTDKQVDGNKVKLVFQLENGEVCCAIYMPYNEKYDGVRMLTMHAADQNRRDDPGRHPGRQ